jgi:hypothetical protein
MAENNVIKITKDKVKPFLDISGTINKGTSWAPTWKRIDKSTIFDLAFNPQSTTEDYIAYETPIEEISGYQPELPQEIALYRGNEIYDYIEDLCYNLEVGDALRVPMLLVWPPQADGTMRAWQIKDCRLLLSNYNSVEGKVTFTLKLGGTYGRGTVTESDGVPVFVEA